jgi:hypothetical protein
MVTVFDDFLGEIHVRTTVADTCHIESKYHGEKYIKNINLFMNETLFSGDE